MNPFHDPAAWEPAPVRPRGRLIRRFVLSVAYRPVHWLWVLLAWGFVLGFASLAEIVTAFSDRAENATVRFLDRLTARTALPRWYVGRREVRHEGDVAYYRALVDEAVARRTEQVAKPKPAVPREYW